MGDAQRRRLLASRKRKSSKALGALRGKRKKRLEFIEQLQERVRFGGLITGPTLAHAPRGAHIFIWEHKWSGLGLESAGGFRPEFSKVI